MFIGREKELATLNGLYNSDKFEFAVIYGRRRVGKTALISHFIQDKKAIYFMGVESNEKQNLENFSQAIMESASGIMPGTSFVSFQAAIEYVFKLCENERLVLVSRTGTNSSSDLRAAGNLFSPTTWYASITSRVRMCC